MKSHWTRLWQIGVIALVGCTQSTTAPTPDQRAADANTAEVNQHPADNTARNVRDRNEGAKTPLDQGNNDKDVAITQQIRKAVIDDTGLSFDARNIKIITLDSVVTLRGPVETAEEKAAIAEKAQRVEGVARVDNQLDVKRR
jgi:osmotically-inducible protein OsmY